MKKYILFLLTIILFNSCTNESSKSSTIPPAPLFSGYKIATSGANANNPTVATSQTIITGTLQNDKFFSETTELILNSVSQGFTSNQYYFYFNSLLDHRVSDSRTTYFYYDSNDRLIGATAVTSSGNLYERYVYNSNNSVYCEIINLPYNDPNAQMIHRNILQFDSNNEVVAAGMDINYDGVMDHTNNFNYSNENLMSISFYNGTVQTFDYSTVIDNFNLITQNSYGKKITRLICSGSFCGLNYDLKYSKNILTQDFLLANYQVLPSNYYEIKTTTENIFDPNTGTTGIITNTSQFYFN